MSEATLKKKSKVLYHSLSVGHNSFSLNGTRRPQGWVGQTSLSRNFPRTLARGSTLRGHGGNYGSFFKGSGNGGNDGNTGIVSGVIDYNDPNIIKGTVINNIGLIDTKYRWVRRPYPYAVVKPDTNLNINSSGQYTDNLQKSVLSSISDLPIVPYKNANSACLNNPELRKIMNIKYNNIDSLQSSCTNSKVVIGNNINDVNSEGLYILSLDESCQALNKTYPKNTSGAPVIGKY